MSHLTLVKIMLKKMHFILLLVFPTLVSSNEVDSVIRSNLILSIANQIEKQSENARCLVAEDLKESTVVFGEEIVAAFNFEKSWTNFDKDTHIYAKKIALENLKDEGRVFEIKDLSNKDEYLIVGCKVRRSFDSSLYYILKNKKNNQDFLISNNDFEKIEKNVKNQYYQFYDQLKNLEYEKISNSLQVVKWSVVQRRVLEILLKNGDEKILDLLLKFKVEIPPRFMSEINYSPLIKHYSKLIHIIPKESRGMYFYGAFLADVPVDVLKLYNDIKKNDIAQSNWPRIVGMACTSDKNSLEKLKLLESIGFNFKERGEENENALHFVSQFGNGNFERCLDFLLSKGININSLDKNGNTPLHRSTSVLNKKFSLYLISKGADPTIKNINGKTPKIQ